jgi:hypothetical protein
MQGNDANGCPALLYCGLRRTWKTSTRTISRSNATQMATDSYGLASLRTVTVAMWSTVGIPYMDLHCHLICILLARRWDSIGSKRFFS